MLSPVLQLSTCGTEHSALPLLCSTCLAAQPPQQVQPCVLCPFQLTLMLPLPAACWGEQSP